MVTPDDFGRTALAANFAAVGAHLAAATTLVTVGGWHVGTVTYDPGRRCVASLFHPTASDPLDGQPVTGWDEVRAYALARGYLRWYRPGEIAP